MNLRAALLSAVLVPSQPGPPTILGRGQVGDTPPTALEDRGSGAGRRLSPRVKGARPFSKDDLPCCPGPATQEPTSVQGFGGTSGLQGLRLPTHPSSLCMVSPPHPVVRLTGVTASAQPQIFSFSLEEGRGQPVAAWLNCPLGQSPPPREAHRGAGRKLLSQRVLGLLCTSGGSQRDLWAHSWWRGARSWGSRERPGAAGPFGLLDRNLWAPGSSGPAGRPWEQLAAGLLSG